MLHDSTTWPIMLMFSAVDCFFWGLVYLVFACCAGELALTLGAVMGMIFGPIAALLGLFLNWLIPWIDSGDQAGTCNGQYGYALVVFGFFFFLVNLKGNLDYRNATTLGTSDPLDPVLSALAALEPMKDKAVKGGVLKDRYKNNQGAAEFIVKTDGGQDVKKTAEEMLAILTDLDKDFEATAKEKLQFLSKIKGSPPEEKKSSA